jgi:hypothetical protein
MTALVTPIAIVSIFATQPFLRLWLGSNVSTVTGPVTVILLVGVWSNALASVAFARLHAIGRPDAPARLHLAELLPYGAALYGGMYLWGLSGAAMAWSARCTVDLTGLALLARLSRELTGSLSFGFVLVLISTFMALGIRDPLLYPLALVYITIALLWSWAILPRNLKSALIAAARRPFTSLRVSR